MLQKIGQVVKNYGISRKTLINLERKKIIEPVRSASNGERRYTEEEIRKLESFLGLKGGGDSVQQISN